MVLRRGSPCSLSSLDSDTWLIPARFASSLWVQISKTRPALRRHPLIITPIYIANSNAAKCQRACSLGLCWILQRSEEHTSELQSLMRISYAVFCLKKKKSKYKNYPPTEL